MKKLFKSILLSALTLFILTYFLPTINYLNLSTLFIAAVVLTLIQSIVKPVFKILFLPINIITLGSFSLIINIFLIWLLTYLVPAFEIKAMTVMGINLNYAMTLLLVSILISFFHSMLSWLLK